MSLNVHEPDYSPCQIQEHALKEIDALLAFHEYFVADDLPDSHCNLPLSGNIVTTSGHHDRQKEKWLLCPQLGEGHLWMDGDEGKLGHQVIAKGVQHQFGFIITLDKVVKAHAGGERRWSNRGPRIPLFHLGGR